METNKNNNKDRHEFDLESRTLEFAKRVAKLCRSLPMDAVNDRPIRQVMGSSGSVGANYREANDALSKKDTIKKMRLSLQEAKETQLHLEVLLEANPKFAHRMHDLIQEAKELKLILSTIVEKLTKPKGSDEKF